MMDKNDSLAFLQSCIDKVDQATPEEILKLRNLYDKYCSGSEKNSEFEFVPPCDNSKIMDTNMDECLKVVITKEMLERRMSKINYSYKYEQVNNIQESETAAYAA